VGGDLEPESKHGIMCKREAQSYNLSARLQWEVIQIRRLKAIGRREAGGGKGQKHGRNVFCFAEPTLPARETPN